MRIPFFNKKREVKTYHQELAGKAVKQLKRVEKNMDSLKLDAKDAHKLSKKSLKKSVKIEQKVNDLAQQVADILANQ